MRTVAASRRSSTRTSTRSTRCRDELDELAARTAVLEGAQRRSFQRVGLVRYNPFEETGGNQSFALALLDAGGDGWVLSSLHARSGTRVYAKAIKAGAPTPGCRTRRRRRSVRRWPDSLGGTAAGDAPDMAPTTPRLRAPTDAVTRPRTRARREPSPLDQLPAWRELVPVMDPAVDRATGRVPGMEALLGGLNPDQLRAVTHGTGPLLVVAGAGTGKTQVITRRIAWLIATRRAKPSEILALTFTDKAAEEMAVRVDQLVPYGYTDTAISTFHAFGDRLIREYALELGLPTDLRVLSRPEVVIFLREHLFEFDLDAYRPLGDPTRFLAALATLFSRCKDEDISPADYLAHADRVAAEARAWRGRRPRRHRMARPTTAADGAAEEAARQAELARAYATYQRLLAANGCIDFGDQVALALRLVRTSPGGARGDRRPVPLHPRRRVPGHEPGPGGARRGARRGPPQRHRRRRRRPGDLRVPRRRRRQHPRVPATAISARARSSCGATTGRSRRSSTRPTG